jgi:hypothetical protein
MTIGQLVGLDVCMNVLLIVIYLYDLVAGGE